MDAMDLARQLARGGRVHELSGYSGRSFRLFAPHATTILTVYRSSSLQRREQRALESLAGIDGLPRVIEWSVESDPAWGLFEDAGAWNLATLPSSSSPARQAGRILRRVHEASPDDLTNLAGGMDAAWLRSEYQSVFSRLGRYRRRVGLSQGQLERALAAEPPVGGVPTSCHTNPRPDRFRVDDESGHVTLTDWSWATAAPAEWDFSLAVWTLRSATGEAAAEALIEGYGRTMPEEILKPWIVFHAGREMLGAAENEDGRLDRLESVLEDLEAALPD
ncbi:MAG: aminoglycoside phosphotransferase family protein [Acidimicrobiia bacterium]|nr:aminoglycoside phosphotransferase family protein [Acidimicrobiia bacterium]